MHRTAFLAIGAMAGSAAYVGSAAADVPVTLAIEAAQTAVAACKANGYNVTVTVMESDMSTRVVLRGDGAPAPTVEIGRRKAYTVIKTGMSSGEFGKTVPAPPGAAGPPPPGPPKMPGPVNGDPNLITWAGGLPIKAGDKIIGAMSASGAPGGDKDEACVNAGLAKLAGKLK
jgi:uncharacterized protein GlcG (DUF336 family)